MTDTIVNVTPPLPYGKKETEHEIRSCLFTIRRMHSIHRPSPEGLLCFANAASKKRWSRRAAFDRGETALFIPNPIYLLNDGLSTSMRENPVSLIDKYRVG